MTMDTPMDSKPVDNKEASPNSPASSATPPEPLPQTKARDELKAAAQQEANIPLWKDFGYFLLHNKKWWLLPIIVILVLLGLLMAVSSTAIAPFIYTVF
jgi:hypothetical protein